MESLVFVSLLLLALCSGNVVSQNPSFEAIYQFGDSISDTGNDVRVTPGGCGNPPYGKTSFPRPTGRCSDGLLMVDYFAQAFGLPLLSPYLDKGGNFSHGVNFAVAGATALSTSSLAVKGLSAGVNTSLMVQLDWFKSYLKTICTSPSDCKAKLAKALFLVGEIGGNDYNSGAFQGKTMQQLYHLVPHVVQTIMAAVKEVINLGAKKIVVPGNFPVGCMTIYLATFKSNDTTSYDENMCLKSWNELASFHNDQLQHAIKDLQKDHTDVSIVYADYFSALSSIFQNAASLGFDKDEMHKACCGTGDKDYNFDKTRMCGSNGVIACPEPNKRVSWDGIHLTQHAYQIMAQGLLKNFPTIHPKKKNFPTVHPKKKNFPTSR